MSGARPTPPRRSSSQKRDFARFVDTVFSALLTRVSSSRDLSGLKRQLLENPNSLSDVLPNSTVADFGDADGFYMVYQSQFSVPNGLETSSWVTLGNVAKLWGNNISVTGYQFASPPNDLNAPWGDKGVSVQVESLQGKNWVNYLNVDFHRFIQDIPPVTKMASTARQSRIMVFEDFAVLLFGDRLYVAFTGFADVSTTEMKDKPQFYGGSLKTSLKFTEVMRLNAEQQRIVAKDPRFFLETINLDFTGLDPDLNHPVTIDSRAKDKDYTRTQIGPSFDIGRLMESKDAFTVDMFWAKQEGSDDYNQQSLGVSVLKGFSIRGSLGQALDDHHQPRRRRIRPTAEHLLRPRERGPAQLGRGRQRRGRLIGDAKANYLSAGRSWATTPSRSATARATPGCPTPDHLDEHLLRWASSGARSPRARPRSSRAAPPSRASTPRSTASTPPTRTTPGSRTSRPPSSATWPRAWCARTSAASPRRSGTCAPPAPSWTTPACAAWWASPRTPSATASPTGRWAAGSPPARRPL